MKRILKQLIGLSLLLVTTNTFSAVLNTSNPNTFLGPYVRLGYANLYDPTTSYAFIVEAGGKNYRLNGTLGLKADEYQRFKVSADLLRQDITYPFVSGNDNVWMNQGAVGADYQYNYLDAFLSPILDLFGYLSKAPSSSLSTIQTPSTAVPFYIDDRRIAGSFASGFGSGFAIQPWKGGVVGIHLNYDDVIYDTENTPTDKNAQGVGGGLSLKQSFSKTVAIGVVMDWRQPYDSISATADLFNIRYYGNTRVGLEYDYIRGKNSLPSTQNAGISFIYSPEQIQTAPSAHYKDKDSVVAPKEPDEDFLTWTSTPAVYMPQVLAIPDPKVSTCLAPSFSGLIPDFSTIGETTLNVAPFFGGSNLKYSITFTPDPGNSISISQAGVITVTPLGDFGSVTVTATNSCGSASSNRFVVGPFA